nr:hypothetical protein [Planctomycetota bacterium]
APIQIEKFRSITISTPLQRLFVKWDKDKTDGPMHATRVQDLVREGLVPSNCLVRGEDESEWCDFDSYQFIKKKIGNATVKLRNPILNEEEDIVELPAAQQQEHVEIEEEIEEENDKPICPIVADKSKHHSHVFTIENHRLRSPYRTTTIIFSVIAITFVSCFAIVYLLIGVDKTNPINELVENLLETENPPSSIDKPKGGANQNTDATSISTPILPPKMKAPEHGPIWIHKQLNIPIFGAHVDPQITGLGRNKFQWYPGVWMPQVFLVDAKATMHSDIEFVTGGSTVQNPIIADYIAVKGYYNTIKFGEETWCWELDEFSPKRTWENKELLYIGKWMGLTNWIGKDLTTKNPEIPWLFSESSLIPGEITLIQDKDNTISKIIGSNRSIAFKRDKQNRPTNAAWFDKRGEHSVEVLRWEYDKQNKPTAVEVFSDKDSKASYIRFKPGYENDRLGTLHGVGESNIIVNGNARSYIYDIHVEYSYDIRNRINFVVLTIEAKKLNKTFDPTDIFLSEFKVTYNYKHNSDYWQSASLSGTKTHTKLSTSRDTNLIKIFPLGTVRFIRELIKVQSP